MPSIRHVHDSTKVSDETLAIDTGGCDQGLRDICQNGCASLRPEGAISLILIKKAIF